MNINAVHAHICEACLKQGKQVVWLHGDENQGDALAHACPKCGGLNWRKWLVPVAQMPKRCPTNQQAQAPTAAPIQVMSLADVMTVFLFGVTAIAVYFLLMQNGSKISELISKAFSKTAKK